MEKLTIDGEPAAHGACVGIGCVSILALYEWLVNRPIAAADIARATSTAADQDALEREIAASFGDPVVGDNAAVEMRAKRAAGDRSERLRRIEQAWPALSERFRALPGAATMQQQLRAAGGAAHPAEIGVGLEKLAADYRRARLIRRRYTVLDLVEDLGWLDDAINALFAAEGFWGRQANTTTSGRPVSVETAVH